MIILKYGSAKQMRKNNPRRKHKCSKCGCKVLLDEEDFKVIDREYDCWRYIYECPYCNKDESFEVYEEIYPWLIGVIIGTILVILAPVLAYNSWQNDHHVYRMSFIIDGKSYTEWTDSYKIIDRDIMFTAGEMKYRVDVDEIVVIDTKTGEEIDVYERGGDNNQEDS